MKKRLGLIFAAIFGLQSLFSLSLENTSSMEEEPVLGSVALLQIRKRYEEGQYDAFLQSSDQAFEVASAEEKLEELYRVREGGILNESWSLQLKQLEQEKNRALLAQVLGQSTQFSQRVRSAAMTTYTEEEEAAVVKMTELHQKRPDDGVNADETRLIALDWEYEYKALHSQIPQNPMTFREEQIALQMEHLDKMLLFSQDFSDQELKKQVEVYSKIFDRRLSMIWDQMDLSLLAKEVTKPETQLEEKVQHTLQTYSEKLSQMTKSWDAGVALPSYKGDCF